MVAVNFWKTSSHLFHGKHTYHLCIWLCLPECSYFHFVSFSKVRWFWILPFKVFAFPKSKLWLIEILVTSSSRQVMKLSNKVSLMTGFCMTSAGVPSQFYCKLLVTLNIVSEDGALHFPVVSSRLCFPCLFVKGNYAVDGEASQTLQFKTWSFFRMLLDEWCHFNQGVMQVFQETHAAKFLNLLHGLEIFILLCIYLCIFTSGIQNQNSRTYVAVEEWTQYLIFSFSSFSHWCHLIFSKTFQMLTLLEESTFPCKSDPRIWWGIYQ